MKRIKLFVIGVFISIIIYNIFSYSYDNYKNNKLNEKIKSYINEEINFPKLLNINRETVGYINISSLDINYPIVRGEDNSYYLNHAFDRSKSESGAIFLDYRNDLDNMSRNTVVYGHGRLDQSMFGKLNITLTKDWFKESNKDILIVTPNYKMLFQIFSVYTIGKESYYLKTYFSSDNYYKEFLEIIMNRSIFDFNTNINVNDKILTLSTCKDNFGKRVVVHAKLVKKVIT